MLPLSRVRHIQGILLGKMSAMGFPLQQEATLETLTIEVLKSSEIENELLPLEQVRSSLARRLGMDVAGLIPADREVEGVVDMMLDATQRFQEALECSPDTALRDIHDLIEKGVLQKNGAGGRSTSYGLAPL